MGGDSPTRGRSRRAFAAAALATTAALAACTAPDGDATAGGAATASGTPTQGAVDAFFAEIEAVRDMGDAIDQHVALQEDVAACMNALGFEYTPLQPGPEVDEVRTAVDLGLERGTREYAEQFGFGITTDDMGYYAMQAAQVDDPNVVYVAALTPAARTEYELALWGPPDQGAEPVPGEPPQGCFAQAQARAGAVLTATESFDPNVFFTELQAMREAILADDRVHARHGTWSDCMADAGFPGLAEPGDNVVTGDAMLQVRAEFDARLVELQGQLTDVSDPSVKLGLAALQARSELADREIAMAVADVDCRESSGYAAALLEVEIEHQARFADDHRAELDAYAAVVAENLARD